MLCKYLFIVNFVSTPKQKLMKTKAYSTLFFSLFCFISIALTAQENKVKKTYLQEGDQIRYIEFYQNGQIAQTGYFLNGKNHGLWTSYNPDGTKKAEGNFKNGKKVDAWFFWNDAVLIEVTFKNNSVFKAIQWDKSEVLASKELK